MGERNEYEKHLFGLVYSEVELTARTRSVNPKRIWHVVDLAYLDGIAIIAAKSHERAAEGDERE